MTFNTIVVLSHQLQLYFRAIAKEMIVVDCFYKPHYEENNLTVSYMFLVASQHS